MDFVRFIFGAMSGIIRGFKAPYAVVIVAMATAAACYMMLNEHLGVEKAAFGFATILAGGFTAKAVLAVAIRALRSAVLMVAATLTLLLVAITATDATVFKDAAVESVAYGIAGMIIVVIGAFLERHQSEANHKGGD